MNWNKLGDLRPNQLITTYGPGAIMDALNDSVTVLDIDYWKKTGKTIYDARLASYLGVHFFRMPNTSEFDDIPVISFPYYHICSSSRCNALFDIRDNFDRDKYIKEKGPKCPYCGWDSYPARFITACEDGHMDDFPWSWWVHRGSSNCKGHLKLYSTGRTSSLAEMIVECSCGAKRTMSGAMQRENLEGLACSGHHPHRPSIKNKKCKQQAMPSQRGASNVYFPVIRSAISIPPWINPLNDLIDHYYKQIVDYRNDFGEMGVDKIYNNYFKDKCTREEFDEAVRRRDEKIKEFTEIKEMEYAAITNHKDLAYQTDVKFFKAEEVEVPEYLDKYFSRVIKVHRLREVMVLLGFMRIDAPEPEVDEPNHIVKLSKGKDNDSWLPGVEINGEGIFIEFSKEAVSNWKSKVEVKTLSDKYARYYEEFCKEKGWTMYKKRDAEYVLLHTFSHLLIKEMAMQSGYSSSAIKERIYSSENMCGLLIYTGSSDKEGSLGGLVELGEMDKFLFLLREALQNALTCTTDPECFMKHPTKDRINGAVCHSCAMISETACENGNRLLDRTLVVPVPERESCGFFRELVNELCGTEI